MGNGAGNGLGIGEWGGTRENPWEWWEGAWLAELKLKSTGTHLSIHCV